MRDQRVPTVAWVVLYLSALCGLGVALLRGLDETIDVLLLVFWLVYLAALTVAVVRTRRGRRP